MYARKENKKLVCVLAARENRSPRVIQRWHERRDSRDVSPWPAEKHRADACAYCVLYVYFTYSMSSLRARSHEAISRSIPRIPCFFPLIISRYIGTFIFIIEIWVSERLLFIYFLNQQKIDIYQLWKSKIFVWYLHTQRHFSNKPFWHFLENREPKKKGEKFNVTSCLFLKVPSRTLYMHPLKKKKNFTGAARVFTYIFRCISKFNTRGEQASAPRAWYAAASYLSPHNAAGLQLSSQHLSPGQ